MGIKSISNSLVCVCVVVPAGRLNEKSLEKYLLVLISLIFSIKVIILSCSSIEIPLISKLVFNVFLHSTYSFFILVVSSTKLLRVAIL